MLLRKDLLMFIILGSLLTGSLRTLSQSDSIKLHKIKFDWELGPPGAGVNCSLHTNLQNSFGIGINSLYIMAIFLPSKQNGGEDASPFLNFDLLNCKLFYRNTINRILTIEYAAKYSFSRFGESFPGTLVLFQPSQYVVQTYGVHIAPIIMKTKVKFKPTLSIVRTVEKPTIFVYFCPLVFIFNL
jgi:hypothetical protein